MTSARWTSFRTATTTVIAAFVIALAGAVPAVADDGDQTITVDGTLVTVMVEPFGEGSVDGGSFEVDTLVEVGGQLLDVPEDVAPANGATGDDVTVTIVADADLAVEEAVEVAAGVAEVEGTAEVVGVTTESTAASVSDEVLAAGTTTRTLTVLPVYWDTTGGATQTSLTSLATSTAQYWSEQSGGRLVLQPDVRGFARIADPGSCSTSTIWNSALAAHGVTQQANQHIVVYFPNRADCGGWAGMASVGGGRVWVNGYQYVDVFAHELGHNLGLGHANKVTCPATSGRTPLVLPLSACTLDEYGDRADVMGIAMPSTTGNLTTAFADYLGWANVTRVAAGQDVTVDVAPLAQTGAMRSVAVAVTGGTVYVDFRPAVGRDVRMRNWAGVQVHYRTADSRGIPVTYLLDMKAASTTSAFSSPSMAAGASWQVPGTSLVVSVASIGSTARVRVGSGTVGTVSSGGGGTTAGTSNGSALERYVTQVYADLFKRSVDPSGLRTWADALAGGAPRVAVANAITYSPEYRSRLITASYQTYLGRRPDPGGLQNWLAVMVAGGTIQQMESGFLASDEFYLRAGSTDAGWVRKLYATVLGRSPASAEVTHWVQVLRSGYSRQAVSLGFLLSTERLTTVVDGYYGELLGRSIDASGRRSWVAAIQGGARVEAIIGGIVASEEYFGKV